MPRIQENDSYDRKQVLAIGGFPESNSQIAKERVLHDLNLLKSVADKILEHNCGLRIVKSFRLGKVADDTEEEKRSHPRPLNVIFQDVDQAQLLLSLRTKLAKLMPGIFFSQTMQHGRD